MRFSYEIVTSTAYVPPVLKPALALFAGVFALVLSAGGTASTGSDHNPNQSGHASPGLRPAGGTTLRATSPAIYEIRLGGSGRRLVGGVGALGFALSKDGSRLAFFRVEREGASVWLVNRDGSGERRLVSGSAVDPILTEFPLAWAPAGDALAYTTMDTAACAPRQVCSETRIVIVDARDGRPLGAIAGGESLRWTPNGRRMVWACDAAPDPYGEREAICFRPSSGGAVQRVDTGFAHRPLPAPRGERVAFTDHWGGDLRVLDLPRRSIRLLANPASAIDGALTWSADGRRIAFATAAGELFSVAAAAGPPRRIGRFRDAATPAWGPGGRRIAFARRRLWTVRPDGTGASRVASDVLSGACLFDSSTAPSCGPAWSPDGRKLYYLAPR